MNKFSRLKEMMSGMPPDILDAHGNPIPEQAPPPADAAQGAMVDMLQQQLQNAEDTGPNSPMEPPVDDTVPHSSEPGSPSFINQLDPEQQEQLMALIAAMSKPAV